MALFAWAPLVSSILHDVSNLVGSILTSVGVSQSIVTMVTSILDHQADYFASLGSGGTVQPAPGPVLASDESHQAVASGDPTAVATHDVAGNTAADLLTQYPPVNHIG